MTQEFEPLVARLEHLERQNRRLKWLAVSALVVAVALTVNLGCAGLRIGRFASVEVNSLAASVIRIREDHEPTPFGDNMLVFQDIDGTVRLRLTSHELSFFEGSQPCLFLQAGKEGGQLSFTGQNNEAFGGLVFARHKAGDDAFRGGLYLGDKNLKGGRVELTAAPEGTQLLLYDQHGKLLSSTPSSPEPNRVRPAG